MTRDYSRQSDLVPEERLAMTPCMVIGCGAVGRNVALQLASVGARTVVLVDFDTVDASNVTTQGFRQDQVGRPKSHVVFEDMLRIDADIKIEAICERWRPARRAPAVFCCVDSMSARKVIHRGAKRSAKFWADARMQGEQCYVYTAHDAESHAAYEATLCDDSEVEPGRCTARSTIYCAAFTAAAMLHQFARWLRGQQPLSVGGSLLEFMPLG